jgi:hypothetical protein
VSIPPHAVVTTIASFKFSIGRPQYPHLVDAITARLHGRCAFPILTRALMPRFIVAMIYENLKLYIIAFILGSNDRFIKFIQKIFPSSTEIAQLNLHL